MSNGDVLRIEVGPGHHGMKFRVVTYNPETGEMDGAFEHNNKDTASSAVHRAVAAHFSKLLKEGSDAEKS